MKQKMLVRNGEVENSLRAAKQKVIAFLPEVNSESTNFLLLLFLTKGACLWQKTEKTYEELDFTDDFIFCKVLTTDKELCMEDVFEENRCLENQELPLQVLPL